MNVRKFMCWVLGLALVFGLLPMANPTYADESQGLQAQTIEWYGLRNTVNGGERSHLFLVGYEHNHVPTAFSAQDGKITYECLEPKVKVDSETGEISLVSNTDLPSNPVVITATAAPVDGYAETKSTYNLYVKTQFENTPNVKKASDADESGKGRITGVTSAMEYELHIPSENQNFQPCPDGELSLPPGIYHIRYRETDTKHHGWLSRVVEIFAHNAVDRNLSVLESHNSDQPASEKLKNGEFVDIQAGKYQGKQFVKWVISPETQLYKYGTNHPIDLTEKRIFFSMPDHDLTVTAVWEDAKRTLFWGGFHGPEIKHVYVVNSSFADYDEHPTASSPEGKDITYRIKESDTKGVSVNEQTGKITVDKGVFTSAVTLTVIATAPQIEGYLASSIEYPLVVKPIFPNREPYRNMRVQQPTKVGEKGIVTGANGLEYMPYRSGSGSVKFQPCGEGSIELDPGQYLFRIIETDEYHHGWLSDVITIKIPSNNSNNSSSGSENSGEGAGSDSSSDTSSRVPSPAPSTTEPAPKAELKQVGNTEDKRVVAAVAAETKVSGTEVKSNIAASVVEQAVTAAEKAIQSGNKAGVEIEVKTQKNTKSISLSLSTTALKTVTESKAENMTVKSGISNITLDKDALASIAKQSKGNVTLSVEKAETKLNQKQKDAIGDAPVYDINLRSGDTKIKSFDGGKLTIAIPYALKAGEKANGVVVWYVDDHGNIEKMETEYDEASKTVVFKTTHLSKYAIGYEEKAAAIQAWMNPFQDVADSAWYYEAVKFVAEKELMHGTSATMFKPALGVTRGMLVAVLYRMEGSPEVGAVSAFADVNPDAYYAKAVAWAQKNGIVEGIGHNKFAPKQQATREQLAVVLRNYAVFKKQSVESMETTANFEGVSSWAVDAMKWSAANGIFQGNQEGEFLPKQNATRAELAKVLKTFLELKNKSFGQTFKCLFGFPDRHFFYPRLFLPVFLRNGLPL